MEDLSIDKVSLGKNIKIYPNSKIGNFTIIEDNVIIGHPSPKEFNYFRKCFHTNHICEIDQFVKGDTMIGKNCLIRSGSIIYSGTRIGSNLDCGHNVVIRENCKIGDEVYIMSNTQIHAEVKIGNNTRLHGVLGNRSIVEDNVAMFGFLVHKYSLERGLREAAPVIKSGAFVGFGAVVIGSVIVGNNAIVGAGAVVTKNVESNTIVVGNPAKILKQRA